jgi:hypothetical protein
LRGFPARLDERRNGEFNPAQRSGVPICLTTIAAAALEASGSANIVRGGLRYKKGRAIPGLSIASVIRAALTMNVEGAACPLIRLRG